jgi:hypothetical protein
MILVFWVVTFAVDLLFPRHGPSFMLGAIFGIALTALCARGAPGVDRTGGRGL